MTSCLQKVSKQTPHSVNLPRSLLESEIFWSRWGAFCVSLWQLIHPPNGQLSSLLPYLSDVSLCLQQLCAVTQLDAGCNVNGHVCPSESVDNFFKRQNDGGVGAAHWEHWLPQAAASLMRTSCTHFIYSHIRPEHNASRTTFRCGLADQITVQLRHIYTSHWHAFFLIWITYVDRDSM